MKKNIFGIAAAIASIMPLTGCSGSEATVTAPDDSKVVVAYVTSWSDEIPDPAYMTHINYAFGHVSESFDSVGIANPDRLSRIVKLKETAPDLKVILSIGGWGSGRFSEMAADSLLRLSFARDCNRVVEQYGLDGIDIDWEYPTSDAAGISASPDDTANFTKLMRDIRQAIGDDKSLTLATVASADYIDFHGILPYIDFVNIMSYDMARAPKHHSPLYSSDNTTGLTTDAAVRAHINAGVPPSMLVVGMPFYGRGTTPFNDFCDYADIEVPEGFSMQWDSIACAPYIADADGNLVLGFDNPGSIAVKCDYILENDLRGAMYWDYAGDNDDNDLRSTVADRILGKTDRSKVLVLNEGGGQHGPFTAAAMKWLRQQARDKNFAVTEINHATPVSGRFLEDFDLVIQLDYPPYTWPEYSQDAFTDYIDNGKGAWIGFHHATLLGEFDGYPMWDWFSDFMGGIRFQNYIAGKADGSIYLEDAAHPVVAGIDSTFVIPDDEWYTYNTSPRPNVHVIASVDENSYNPPSDIRMGDHPVIWTNESKKARNVYFQIGHSEKLLGNDSFKRLFSNAIDWCLADTQ